MTKNDPMQMMANRIQQTVSQISGVEEEYSQLLGRVHKSTDKLTEILRGMDELDILQESIHESRKKLTQLTAALRQEMVAGVFHLKENAESLTDVQSNLADDATILIQQMTVLFQTNPEVVGDALRSSSDESRKTALSTLGLETLSAWQQDINAAIADKGAEGA